MYNNNSKDFSYEEISLCNDKINTLFVIYFVMVVIFLCFYYQLRY